MKEPTLLAEVRVRVSFLCVALALAMGCRGSKEPVPAAAPPQTAVVSPGTGPAVPARHRIVILGDSLTAGLGLDQGEAYPARLQERIDAAALPFEVSAAGVSGDTSAGGLSRLEWALGDNPRILIVALGGNDALRGLPLAELQRNLSTIIERAQARRIRVLLVGMEAPPNFGRDYTVAFHQVYPDLAKRYGIPLVPFLLQDVAGVESLNQPDGIHPTAEGARIIANNVWAILRPLLTAP
ncbi:MAG: arylesterase [Vicinamibacterales bacterium]